jgi:hypothetical protein
VQWNGAGGFTLRTIGAFVRDVPTPCIVPIAAGSTALAVHAAGDSAILSTIGAGMIAPIPASGWYAIPVNPAGDELVVEPDLRGGDLTLTVVIPQR